MPARPAMTKVDLTPKRHHAFNVLLFILGTLLPPLAVAARFGIGKDFWLNLFLTICGYIPGHVHNFYIQNVRNNKNHRRTPKWAQRYGLVDTSEIKRKQKKSQWATRYNDRLPESTLQDQPYEEGQEGRGSSIDLSAEGGEGARRQQANGELWRPEDESYYGRNGDASSTKTGSSGGRWHYPANFEDAMPAGGGSTKRSKKKKDKKDRFARTEDAYSISEEAAPKKRKSRKKKSRSSLGDDSLASTDFPEDPEGGLYDARRGDAPEPAQNGRATGDEVFNHEF